MLFFSRARPRPHYGWVVLALSFITQGLTYTVWYCFSLFFVPLLGEYGWSRANTAGVFSTFVIVNALSGPLVGGLIDRLGARLVVPIGAVLMAVGLALCGRLTDLWQFYLFFGLLVGLGLGICGWIAQAALLAPWFPRSMGSATGLSSAGTGVAMFLLVPQIQQVIEAVGWRFAFDALAAIVLLGIAPANLLLQRRPRSGELETMLAGPGRERASAEEGQIVDREWVKQEWTLARAVSTPRFWMLFCGSMGGTLAIQLQLVHQVAYFVDLGFSLAVGAAVVGLLGIASTFAKITWGALSDRLGREMTYSLGMLWVMSSISLLLLAGISPAPWIPYAFGVVMGIGYAVSAPLVPSTTADLFKGPNYGAIFGAMGFANGMGSASGPWIAGLIFDLTGSYRAAFVLALCTCTVGIVGYWVAAPRRVRLVPGKVRKVEAEQPPSLSV